MKTFIFGHKKPDSDAVMSAIGLSYLKNELGEDTEPRVLGTINKETKYALKYFDLQEPKYLNDVKLQILDTGYHKDAKIFEKASIYDGYQYMIREGLTGLPIVHDDKTFSGLITLKDLSETMVNENIEELYTSYDNLLTVLKGEEIVRIDEEIIGKLLVASYRSTTFLNSVKLDKNMVLIVGDRHSIIEYAISSGVKLIILSSDSDMHESHIEEAKEQGVNVIRTPYDTYHIAKLVSLANYVKTIIKIYNPITFLNTDYVDDVLEKNEKLRHTNYPIIDKNNKCLGLLKITDLNDRVPKKVILVDHNEKAQSVDGIEEAEIKEIIDHHNLGSITTTSPINFRNVVLGSTCTIVYTLFKERGIGIPKRIAGALITGILSDTLILSSPTATDIDRQAVTDLARIAEVDYEVYGMSLIKAGTSMEGMTKEDVIYNDFKAFTINGKTFAIGQFFTTDFSEIEKDIPEYVKALDKVAENNNYQLVCLYFTDIIKKGSYVLYNTFGKNYIELAYNESNLLEGTYIENCVSRKKHMVPIIMEVME